MITKANRIDQLESDVKFENTDQKVHQSSDLAFISTLRQNDVSTSQDLSIKMT